MTLLDEKEKTISLKAIVVVVGLVTFGGFAILFAVANSGAQSQPPQSNQRNL